MDSPGTGARSPGMPRPALRPPRGDRPKGPGARRAAGWTGWQKFALFAFFRFPGSLTINWILKRFRPVPKCHQIFQYRAKKFNSKWLSHNRIISTKMSQCNLKTRTIQNLQICKHRPLASVGVNLVFTRSSRTACGDVISFMDVPPFTFLFDILFFFP